MFDALADRRYHARLEKRDWGIPSLTTRFQGKTWKVGCEETGDEFSYSNTFSFLLTWLW